MSGNIYIIADGNWLLWRAFSVIGQRTIRPEERIPDQILSWFCEYALRLRGTHGAIAFDGNNNFRNQLYAKYKSSRSGEGSDHDAVVKTGAFQGMAASDAVYSMLPHTANLFQHHGLTVVQRNEFEADDQLASAAHRFGIKDNHVYLVTRDKDMIQCVNERVSLYTPAMQLKPEIIYTPASTVKLKNGLSPKQFLDYQILMGDSMDDVPPVPAMTEKWARSILKEHGSLASFFKTTEGKEFYNLRRTELHRNKDLVGLSKRTFDVDSKLLSFRRLHGTANSKAFTTLRDLQTKTSLF